MNSLSIADLRIPIISTDEMREVVYEKLGFNVNNVMERILKLLNK